MPEYLRYIVIGGRAPYGARGLKSPVNFINRGWSRRRAPYGARGLKFAAGRAAGRVGIASRPVRGAWIEMIAPTPTNTGSVSRPVRGAWIEIGRAAPDLRLGLPCRAPYGARGLKFSAQSEKSSGSARRAPYGARGLKLHRVASVARLRRSRPVRGAWIEICRQVVISTNHSQSRPVRGAWIEIRYPALYNTAFRVAPRTGRVD